MTRYFVGLVPPETVSQFVRDLQYRVGPMGQAAAKKTEPHVTLIVTFETATPLQVLVDKLAAVVVNQIPFDLRTSQIGSFPKHVWYVDTEPGNKIRTLATQLQAVVELLPDLRYPIEPRPFRPHLTIASRLNDETFDAMEKQLSAIRVPSTTWAVDRIWLFDWHTDHWERLKPIPMRT